MSDIRSKVNSILYSDNSSTNYKKELTNGIVNEIKSKIKDFKEKKHSDKNSNKQNELDFEINKDLLNKFKKIPTNEDRDHSAGKNLNSEGGNPSRKLEILTNGNNNLKQTNMNNKERNEANFSKKLIENFHNQIININKENNFNNINTVTLNKNEKTKQKVLLENINIKNSETLTKNNSIKSFLKTNTNLDEKISNRLNTGHKKSSLDLKKTNLVEFLTKDSITPKDRHDNNISTHSNKSIDDRNKNQNRMKDKIRSFVFEIEGVTTKANPHSAKDLPRQIQKEPIRYEYNTNNVNSLNDYSVNGNKDYKLKNNSGNLNIYNGNNCKSPKTKEDKTPPNFFEIKKDKTKADDFFTTMVENKLESPTNALKLKPDDIKNISTKLRFASTDEIRKMDENLIEELINLSTIINRLFEWRIKAKNFK